jgi:hypothetical protein
MITRIITLETVVQASPDQVSCDLQGEAAILNLKTGVYYCLDPVGAAVWKLVEQRCTLASIRDVILAEYDVDAARCERDLFELLEVLAAEGLIDVRFAVA